MEWDLNEFRKPEGKGVLDKTEKKPSKKQRGAPRKETPANKRVQIYVSQKDKDKLRREANEVGLKSLSDFLKMRMKQCGII